MITFTLGFERQTLSQLKVFCETNSQIFIIHVFEVQAKPRRSPTIPPRRKKSLKEIESTAYIADPSEFQRTESQAHNPLGKTISNPKPQKLAQVTYSDVYVKKAGEIT